MPTGGPFCAVAEREGAFLPCEGSPGRIPPTPPTGRLCYRNLRQQRGSPGLTDALRVQPGPGGSHLYGPNGNVVRNATVDSTAGITTDVRDSASRPPSDHITARNQLLRRDVTSLDGRTGAWRYPYRTAPTD